MSFTEREASGDVSMHCVVLCRIVSGRTGCRVVQCLGGIGCRVSARHGCYVCVRVLSPLPHIRISGSHSPTIAYIHLQLSSIE